MYEHCRGCIRYQKSCSGMTKAVCEKHRLRIPRTNADRIRAMADEELADLFADNDCGYCRIHDLCFAKGCQIDCEDMWLDWLRQEVSDEGT